MTGIKKEEKGEEVDPSKMPKTVSVNHTRTATKANRHQSEGRPPYQGLPQVLHHLGLFPFTQSRVQRLIFSGQSILSRDNRFHDRRRFVELIHVEGSRLSGSWLPFGHPLCHRRTRRAPACAWLTGSVQVGNQHK